jgi:CheY-like chemotaxis protein
MKKRILIVDDSATMRMLLSLTVKKTILGVALTEAENGLDALEKLRKDEYDLVLTDMQMPEMNGAQLVSAIRNDLSKNLPVIIVTTKGDEKDRDFGMSLGASGYITKPIDGAELKSAVMKFLH